MKRINLCRAAAALLSVLLLAGCGGASSAPAPAEPPAASEAAAYAFTDDLGREVALEAAPRRVAALTGSYADIWCTAGGKDTLTASASE